MRTMVALLLVPLIASPGLSACQQDDPPSDCVEPQAGNGGSAGAAQPPPDPDLCKTEAQCVSYRTTAADPVPAPPPSGVAEGDEAVQVVSEWFLGETDRGSFGGGAHDPDAWQHYGFDLDGWMSAVGQGFHCQPQADGKASVIRVDGPGGVDNAFGQTIIGSVLAPLIVDPSERATSGAATGVRSLLLDVKALGSASDYVSLEGGLMAVQGDGAAPLNGDWSSYAWHPIEAASPFGRAYLSKGVLVAEALRPVRLSLLLGAGAIADLEVLNARLTVDLSDRKNGKNGVLGGILSTESLVASFRHVGPHLSSSLCDETGLQATIEKFLRRASDIPVDGVQDPAKVCDGISIGVGFSTRAALRGDTVAAAEATDPCAGP